MPLTVADSPTFSMLHTVSQMLASSADTATLLQQVLQAIATTVQAERGVILLDQAGKGHQFAAGYQIQKADLDQPELAVVCTLVDFVITAGEAMLIEDAHSDSRTASPNSPPPPMRSVLCLPLKAQGKVAGAIYLDHLSQPGHFGQAELVLAETVAHQTAVAIQNARLNAVARTHAQRLEQLKAYQDSILQNVSTGIVAMDTQGRIISLNRAAADLFGVDDSAILNRSYKQLLGEELAGSLMSAFRAALSGQATQRATFQVSGGNAKALRCSVTPLRDNAAAVTGLVLLIDDDTPRVQAEGARDQVQAQYQQIRQLFSRYVPEAVVEKILADPRGATQRITPKQREISVLFADVRGFTTLSERSSPERLVVTLNRYLKVAADTVIEHKGTLDKFMGDGVMATFNTPTDLADHALAAVRTAWAMQRKAARFMEGVSFGVGVNTGPAIVGNIGTDQIQQYSCIGDTVNVASRLQGHAEGGHVVITRATFDRVRGHVQVKPLGAVPVKGRAMAVEAFEVINVT
jgi:PAS domain S-box-containing protein